jgi:hypothetical protein
MYWKDHAPAHIHAAYGEHEVQVSIEDGTVLAGRLPRTACRLVAEWVETRREDLRSNWARAQAHEPLVPIEPPQ